ncbi:MAG: Asp-tRNA(Asn)/Glu-tRNA(Gln) amidotransferase subunit GatB [Candidatus Babeliales bacterium]
MPSPLERYPTYTSNIGIEVHVQLSTKTKIFCTCDNTVCKEPNKNICPVCAGYPGVLPVLNQQVVHYAIMMGLATHCKIAPKTYFDRKHYFYPDLPKGYQITQNDHPICSQGYVTIRLEDGSSKKIRLTRIHMEEDAGKNIHSPVSNESFVDLNRAGTPLLEIVTYPDIANAYEARAYLKALHTIVRYINVGTANMEEGAFRADTNISVRKKDTEKLGTRVEMKNINSFKFISDAIDYEIERHIELIESGQKIRQETRLWDTKNHKTIMMRSKEEAADYRYFQEPDLPLLEITPEFIQRAQDDLPELPDQKLERLMKKNGLSEYEAAIIVDDLELSKYYEQAAAINPSKTIVNWILRDILGYLKEHKIELAALKVTPKKLATIVTLLENDTINNKAAKEIFDAVAQTGGEPESIMETQGLKAIGSSDELEAIVIEIIKANPEVVADYKSGKDRLFGFFVGQAMKQTSGKGNPKILSDLFKKHLG